MKTSADSDITVEKKYFAATNDEWLLALAFLTSLSLVGLGLYIFYIAVFFLLIFSFIRKREAFVVQLFILSTYSGFVNDTQFPVKWCDILLCISFILLIVYQYNNRINKINIILFLYFFGILLIAFASSESIWLQLRMMRYYFMPFCYLIPLVLLHKNPDISFLETGRFVILYSVLIALFYMLDGFVLNGHVLLPNTPVDGEMGISRWDDLYWIPFSTYFPRKYPQGLFIFIPASYFVVRYYRLAPIYWIVIAASFVAMRTMTVIAGIICSYVCSMTSALKAKRLSLTLMIVFIPLYFIDKDTGEFMRVSSTVDQFLTLKDAIDTQDVETLAAFASGRLAQAYPKWELLQSTGHTLTGFGFIHPERSARIDLLNHNRLYIDQDKDTALELPVDVEITQFQTLLNIGILGLIFQIVIFVLLAIFVLRYFTNGRLFLASLVGISVCGLGGFAGLTTPYTLWLAFTLALAVLKERTPILKKI